ncbi:MAG: glycosyltransferase [Proteobacteria bacterium]|nr:glycosyltransferase [Pseudomonadota bacterium]
MRLAFASIGSLGDLHPMLAMAVGAARRGHDVVVAAAPGYAGNVARAGLEFHPLRPTIPEDAESLAYYFDMKSGPRRLLRDMIFTEVAATHEDLCGAARGADLLVVGELLYTAPVVAAAEKIPWLNVVLAPTSMLSATDPCVLAPAPWLHKFRHLGPWLHRLAYCFGRLEGRMWAGGYYRFRRSLGLPPGANPIFDAKHSPFGTLAMFPDFLASP